MVTVSRLRLHKQEDLLKQIRPLTAADYLRMMKQSAKVTGCCVALFLVLSSVAAANKKLESINDLKKIDFGQSVPKHSLLLLHWFANEVDMDNNNVIRLTFDLNNGDYGSHHYGNYEGLLDPLPSGYQYYIIGKLNQETSMELPDYVVNPRRGYAGRNRDRIIIRVQTTGRRATQRIDRVYITQHYGNSMDSTYDLDHTHQISPNLLRQIREFSLRDNNRQLLTLRHRYGSNADELRIRQMWGNLACLGLFLFIVIEEKNYLNQHNNRPPNNNRPQNNNRPPNNNRPQNNSRQESRQGPCSPLCFRICCFCCFAVILLVLSMIYLISL